MFSIEKYKKNKIKPLTLKEEKLHRIPNKIPIAIVYNLKNNKPKKIIYLINNPEITQENEDEIFKIIFKQIKKDKIDISKFDRHCPLCFKDADLKYIQPKHYKTCEYILNKIENYKLQYVPENEIKLKKNEIIKSQFPNIVLRDIVYISGPQGSGKSTYIKNYMVEFKKIYKSEIIYDDDSSISEESKMLELLEIMEIMDEYDMELEDPEPLPVEKDGIRYKDIFLFSRISDDESFQDFNLKQIDLNNTELIDNPIKCKEDIPNSLVIFDDYDTFDAKIRKSLEMTLNDILLNGRDQANEGRDIYVCVSSHQLMNYRKTRDIINEASSITFFPKATNYYQINRLLKEYIGFDKFLIKKIYKLPSRWVTIYKRYPKYILYEKGIFSPNINIFN